MKKIKVAVIYGGKSGEHEVSLRSAASVIRNLDTSRFEIIPIGIDKAGAWHRQSLSEIKSYLDNSLPALAMSPALPIFPQLNKGSTAVATTQAPQVSINDIDVFFPVMHGPHCEDGKIQGLFDLANIPYVGAGVLGSAVGMDKEISKKLAASVGVNIVPYFTIRKIEWQKNAALLKKKVADFSYPVFIKPANMGSSVGIHKVKKAEDLDAAIQDAFQFDTKVLIEKSINAREIEMAVLEPKNPLDELITGVPGEVATASTHEFYSYEAKYLDENGAALHIPAKLSKSECETVEAMAKKIFVAVECSGLARIDFFLDKNDGTFYFNEINTLPGFTSISMYPKMMAAKGIPYQELLSRLIDLAIQKHAEKDALKNDYKS